MFSGSTANAAATENARDRDAAAAVIAGRGPDRAVAGGVELAGDDARREAAEGARTLWARIIGTVDKREREAGRNAVSSGGNSMTAGVARGRGATRR